MIRGSGYWSFFVIFVKTSEVDAEPQGAVLLFDEEDRSSAWGTGWAYEAVGEMFVNKLPERLEFIWGQGINWTKGGMAPSSSSIFRSYG